ncbi:hypothetical protein [Bifidobacterium subtile]|jgi:hypothetical protein|uniref:Uncharacterized protein n=1 Tax=Bifidobacterium subtile TaxID=77635 RepID=A0A087E0H6_9BIFI|nr:hypothetical protein [Bifidobacterium subtile]KFJ01277.1 hypothetical protein BISU_1863 [Bifidobacterium subtile]MCI1223472.1 hypothetical protein [Bifidobacterium subtile]MCI1242092.1 hypothetical protein [Bifidobacterium subtile]MCI1259040.1 hypothetical protein [Bifidobacterium subtile]QOL37063.1 hypothetical protein BS3272_03785 [Bifidobacterium subtile]
MSESMGHRHIRITRSSGLGVTRTEVEITTDELAEERIISPNLYSHDHSSQHVHDSGECFDTSCCDAREKALIRSLRAYLRPQIAPDCLITRLNQALDHYCEVNLPDRRSDAQ